VKRHIVTEFWSHFPGDVSRKYCPESYEHFTNAVLFLRQSIIKVEKVLGHRSECKTAFYNALRDALLSSRPFHLNEWIEGAYFRSFRVYLNLRKKRQQEDPSGESIETDEQENEYEDYDEYCMIRCGFPTEEYLVEDMCPGCGRTIEACSCQSIQEKFSKINQILRDLNLLEDMVGDTIMLVSRVFIERRVNNIGKSNYSCSYLSELTSWVNDVVKSWLIDIYGPNDEEKLKHLNQELDRFLKDAYAEVRVSHMFEIIIEFPNSEAAIQDLKLCLEQSTSSSFRFNLIDSVKQSLVESLLHPGVNTYDILTAYISAIKALRALDPSGLILQLVTEPVRRYLKSRSDTVRCIVTALTDEDHNSELNREMIKGSTQTNENGIDGKGSVVEMNIPSEGEKCTATNFDKWRPDPIKLSTSDENTKSSRFSDIVSILVNIYETKDLFVEEYQKLLSQRLLNKFDECNLDSELRNLELLTLRFSDCELHRCEVMLKDVQTSKRINKRVLSGDIRQHKLTTFKNMDVLIISSPFWPERFGPISTLYDEPPKTRFPEEVQSAIDTYNKAFESVQASRTLHWRHHLGCVNMDVKINGKVHNFTVTPIHASLLYLFKDKKSWRIHELIQETSLTAAALKSRLAFWQRNGLIRDCGEDKFELIQDNR